MSALDPGSLLQPVTDDSPSGDDIEYDPKFQEMERAAQGRPEQVMGDAVVPAEEPDWKTVTSLALELLVRSKDLRVATLLTRGLTHTAGLGGLRDGLTLVRGLLEQFWGTVHPQLDAEDDNDPTMRVNALLGLVDPGLLSLVGNATLVRSAALGAFSYRDYRIASGDLAVPASDEAPPSMSMFDGAFIDSDPADLEMTGEVLREAIESAEAIEAVLGENLLPGQLPDLGNLGRMLREMNAIFMQRSAPGDETLEAPAAEDTGAAAPAGTGAAPPPRAAGEINSRDDVVRMLDKASEYYRLNEPNSPVPLLLQRAKRLVTMDFMEVMRDIAPEGAHQAAKVCGVELDE